ncbi:MAG: CsiV family protein [Kistimonas sp.]|nr:CsiV family protein [Kistimonas sp.]
MKPNALHPASARLATTLPGQAPAPGHNKGQTPASCTLLSVLLGMLLLLPASGQLAAQTPSRPAPDSSRVKERVKEDVPWYQVDVLVFRHANADASAESLPGGSHKHHMPARMVTLKQPSPPCSDAEAFVALPEASSGLARQAAILRSSPQYQLLWNNSWRMPLQSGTRPVAVSVMASPRAGRHYQLEGALLVSRQRFVHIETRLWFKEINPVRPLEHILADTPVLAPPEPVASLAIASQPDHLFPPPGHALKCWPADTVYYSHSRPFFASKQMTLDKTAYIDNVELGVIAKVRSWQRPDSDPTREQAPLPPAGRAASGGPDA